MSDSKKTYIVGYSGHSYVVLDAWIASGNRADGYVDIKFKSADPFNLRFVDESTLAELAGTREINLIMGIGDNLIREQLVEQFKSLNFSLVNVIHPGARISEKVEIGVANYFGCNAVVNPLVKLGDGVIINTGAIIEHECDVSDFVHVAPGAVLAGNVRLGKRTFVGAGAIIKQGLSITNDVIIGAGAVVVKSIEIPGIYVGNPAKRIK